MAVGRRHTTDSGAAFVTPHAGEVLIFLHIPKTAGSTLMRILENQYGSERVLKLYDSTYGDEVASLSAEELSRTRVIAGHFYFGAHHRLPARFRYLTFLREPVARVLSHYEFVRRRPEHYLHEAASSLSLADYVHFCGAAEPNNDQTRLLAGAEMASSDGTCSPAMLPAAKRNLDLHAAVGLTEAFDASLVLMGRTFGWKRPLYVRRNVSARSDGEATLSAQAREVVEEHNSLDAELYGYACERFRRDVADYGGDFPRDEWISRQVNAVYGRLHGLSAVRIRPSTTTRK
jgi:hypothetical protein